MILFRRINQNKNYQWYYNKDNAGNIILDDGNPTYLRNNSFNHFLATHTCCNPNSWTVYDEDYSCFKETPELGCFGGSDQAKGFGPGYLLEEKSLEYYCDGKRGNICGGEDGDKKDSTDWCC